MDIDINVLEQIAKDENDMRLSQQYRDLCSQVKYIPNGWIDVTSKIQYDIVSKYYKDKHMINYIIYKLQTAHHYYNNPIFHERIQVKYNYATKGKYKIGDIVKINRLKKGVNIMLGSSVT
jgi:hypothetical protein